GRSRHDLGRCRAHPLADDVLEDLSSRAGRRALRAPAGPLVFALESRLSAHSVALARNVAGAGRPRTDAARRRGIPVHDLEVRARTPGRSGSRAVSADRTTGCDARADADLLGPGVCGSTLAARVRGAVPDHRLPGGPLGLWLTS